MAYTRKLTALGYHSSNTFDINDEKQARNLIVWLEDQKICFYDIANREPLRDIESKYWVSALKKHMNGACSVGLNYLQELKESVQIRSQSVRNCFRSNYLADLKCPLQNLSDKQAIINWLLSHAVQLVYEENAKSYNEEAGNRKNTTVDSNSWLHSIDCNDANLRNGIESLRKALNIPQHPDHIIVLQAIAKVVSERLSSTHETEVRSSTTYLSLDDACLGFNVSDNEVRDAAKIIRLLQIHRLRDLQTDINKSIVAVQRLSANPKTDQSLGKVGR